MEPTAAKSPRRAGAWTLVILGILGLVLVLGGTIAVWAVNGPVTDLLTTTLAAVARPLERAETGLENVNATLDKARASVDELQATVATIGENLKADSLVLRTLGTLVGKDLKGSVDKAVATLQNVRSTVSTVESVLKSLDRLPGVTLPAWVDDVSAAIDQLQSLGQQVQETVAAVDALRTGAIEQAVASVTEKAGVLETRLSDVEARTQAAQTGVSNLLTSLQTWQARIPGIIDGIAVVLTLFFLLMGLGQWALLSLGWSRVKTGQWIPFYPVRKAGLVSASA
jgi:F0F1-type ATP synthase membrane subunit b/b'